MIAREWHRSVPRGLGENMEWRRDLLLRAKGDRRFQAGLMEVCGEDSAFWVNAFVWQFNPKKKGRGQQTGPFLTWPVQEKAMRTIESCVEDGRDLVIEKSREMGASWMLLFMFLHRFLFLEGQALALLSRNEKAVESESPDSLYWKLDFILDHLPDWMKPADFVRRKLFMGTKRLNNFIAGEATTGKAGVGGRSTAMGIDEFSQIDDDFEILHRTSDTTDCRIFNFTHKGLDTAAYHLTQRPDIRKLRMHWSEHPEKVRGAYRYDRERGAVVIQDKTYPFPADYPFVADGTPLGGPEPGLRSPWYDDQCRRKGDSRAVAMDLDINAEGTLSQFFDPVEVEGLRQLYVADPVWEGGLSYDKDDPISEPKLVPEPNGRLKLWVLPNRGGKPPAGRYVIGADVAAGSGATPSCASVVNKETGEKVGEYTDPFIDAKDYGVFLVNLARAFSSLDGEPATLIWEIPGPGLTAGKEILKLGFRNVYWKTNDFSLAKKRSDQPGWYNHPETQDDLLREYRDALRERRFVNHSLGALKECLKFSYVEGHVKHAGEASPNDPSGARQNHGDHVIADALANKLCKAKARAPDEAPQAPTNHPGTLAGRRWLAQNKDRTRLYG